MLLRGEERMARRPRRLQEDQGSMLTLMGMGAKNVQPKLHIIHEVRDSKDNVRELTTIGVPEDEDEEQASWEYWLSHTGGIHHG